MDPTSVSTSSASSLYSPSTNTLTPGFTGAHQPLTEAQIQILNAFRADLLKDGHLKPGNSLGTDDETLLRFLRARKFNPTLAKRMITQCLQWRDQYEGIGIDGLYKEIDPFNFPNRDQVFQYWPIYYHRIDKLGRPINIQMFGALDPNKLYSVIDKQTHFRTVVANCEALTREILPACTYKKQQAELHARGDDAPTMPSAPHGSPLPSSAAKVTEAFIIIDLRGFTVNQFWQIKGVARACFSISQDYYPETMGYLAIVNAPKSFAAIFKAMTPWLSKDTISKINILGDDYQSTLLEHVDAENLPHYLGGKCECAKDRPWSCSLNDEGFEQSPWLKDRDWKAESWRKFYAGDEPGSGEESGASVRTSGTHSGHGEDSEVTDGGMTQDGALIINTSKKDGRTSPAATGQVAPNPHSDL